MEACNSDFFQAVRIVDVFVLGPAMLKIGNKIGGPLGTFITLAGIATIVFNGVTYLDINRSK